MSISYAVFRPKQKNGRLTHQAREAVDLGRARAALRGLAIPAHGQVSREVRLNPPHRVQDNHPLSYRHLVRDQLAPRGVATPDLQVEVGDRDLFFFNDTATTEIYTLSLHDALPIA